MLNSSCERFRATFEPHAATTAPEIGAHRRSCTACATWAERLEAFTPRETRQPMPDGLRRRLLAISRQSPRVSCGDVERLYEATRKRAETGDVDPAVAEHLESCGRCRMLYSTLGAAFRELRRPLPRALVRRLRRIVEPASVPLLVRDSRIAVAASAFLTASLLLLVGNPVAAVRTTAETVGARATVLAEAGEERRQALLEELADDLEAGYQRGREILVDHGNAYKKLWYEAQGIYNDEKWRQLLESLTLEGENDGKP